MKRILILLIIGEKISQKIAKLLVVFLGVLHSRQQAEDEGDADDYQEGSSLTNNQEKLRKVLLF